MPVYDPSSTAEMIFIEEDGLGHERYCPNLIDQRLRESLRKIDPRSRVDITIGLDLGTSCTKVVWRYRDRSYPVCFGKDPGSISDYLYPSTVHFDGKTLQTDPDQGRDRHWRTEFSVTHFKVCLACENNPNSPCKIGRCALTTWNSELFSGDLRGSEVSFIMAYYLASVLARARGLIVDAFEKKIHPIDPRNIRWKVCMAVPNRYMIYENITSEYELALKTGCLMSFALENLNRKSSARLMKQCYFHASRQAKSNPLDCFIVPEAAAQVDAFTRSRATVDGLYTLVDVGAGTVDASVFRIYSPPNQDRRLSDYATMVLNTGSGFIESLALGWFAPEEMSNDREGVSRQYARNRLREMLRQMKENDGAPVTVHPTLPAGELKQSLDEASVRVESRVHDMLKKLFVEAYQHERNADRWTNLKLILGGGGAVSPVYRKSSTRAFSLMNPLPVRPPRLIEFNLPDDFQLGYLRQNQFHRFAVAYGLALNESERMRFKGIGHRTQDM